MKKSVLIFVPFLPSAVLTTEAWLLSFCGRGNSQPFYMINDDVFDIIASMLMNKATLQFHDAYLPLVTFLSLEEKGVLEKRLERGTKKSRGISLSTFGWLSSSCFASVSVEWRKEWKRGMITTMMIPKGVAMITSPVYAAVDCSIQCLSTYYDIYDG